MITVRIMYTERSERDQAFEILRVLTSALRSQGYVVRRSKKVYPTRKHPGGGRIYVVVTPVRVQKR